MLHHIPSARRGRGNAVMKDKGGKINALCFDEITVKRLRKKQAKNTNEIFRQIG